MRLVDAEEVRQIFDFEVDSGATDLFDAFDTAIESATAVEAYTAEQVAGIIQRSNDLEAEERELRKQVAWLKSCVNCKIRKECRRHGSKVVHDCDHWEYGDPVKHGEWEITEDDWDDEVIYECSVCKESFVTLDEAPVENLWNYCPNCGAKMDGGADH